jgi:hypothetical protein
LEWRHPRYCYWDSGAGIGSGSGFRAGDDDVLGGSSLATITIGGARIIARGFAAAGNGSGSATPLSSGRSNVGIVLILNGNISVNATDRFGIGGGQGFVGIAPVTNVTILNGDITVIGDQAPESDPPRVPESRPLQFETAASARRALSAPPSAWAMAGPRAHRWVNSES